MTGAITISLDFEAGWGVIGNGAWREREASGVYRELRPVLKRFIGLLDTLEISCIWAVIGAMIEAPEKQDISHLKGAYAQKARTFLDEAEPQTRDGRDLLEMVVGAKQAQTFGTHGYSHVLFTDPEQDASVYRGEFQRACAANKAAGIGAEFFVFPENRAAHFELLGDAGIKTARMPARNTPHPDQRPGRLRRAVGSVLRPVAPVYETTHPSGVCLHAGSELLNWGAGAGALKTAVTKTRIARALKAAKHGAHIHYWLHPFDLVGTKGLLTYTEQMLTQAARLRDAGDINFKVIA